MRPVIILLYYIYKVVAKEKSYRSLIKKSIDASHHVFFFKTPADDDNVLAVTFDGIIAVLSKIQAVGITQRVGVTNLIAVLTYLKPPLFFVIFVLV